MTRGRCVAFGVNERLELVEWTATRGDKVSPWHWALMLLLLRDYATFDYAT